MRRIMRISRATELKAGEEYTSVTTWEFGVE